MNIDPMTAYENALNPTSKTKSDHPEMKRLKQVVGDITGRVFFGTILAQARSSSLKSKFGHGGRGEEVFGPQLDALISEQVGKSMKSGVAEAMYSRMAEQQQRLIEDEQRQKPMWFEQMV